MHFNYSNTYFHKDLFLNENCIVDNEIANDISSDWNYEKGIPILVGFLHKDRIDIFVAESENDTDFSEAVKNFMIEKAKVTKLYAFNNKMEIGNFKGHWGWKIPIKEIKPFKARAWNKDRFYNELIAKEVIPDCKVADVFSGDASLCITNWGLYLNSGKKEYLMEIVQHNINCLLKESVILNNHEFFLNSYKLNDRGWLEE